MSGMTAFLIGVGGVSMVCYWLMTRVQNRSARRSSTSDGPSNDYSYDSSSSGGWNIAGWFSGDNSSSGTSGTSGSWDSGGGADSGGGGDGGGGD